jgi:acyl carrier protein
MTEPTISFRMQRIVAEVFSIPVDSVTSKSSPETVEGWDSVGHLNLVLALEQEFHVQFSPDDIEKMVNVEKIIHALNGAEQAGTVRNGM